MLSLLFWRRVKLLLLDLPFGISGFTMACLLMPPYEFLFIDYGWAYLLESGVTFDSDIVSEWSVYAVKLADVFDC